MIKNSFLNIIFSALLVLLLLGGVAMGFDHNGVGQRITLIAFYFLGIGTFFYLLKLIH